MTPTGSFAPRRYWAVTRDDREWPVVPFQFREKADAAEIETERMGVRIALDKCQIVCYTKEGKPFAEDSDFGMGWRLGAMPLSLSGSPSESQAIEVIHKALDLGVSRFHAARDSGDSAAG
jgi:hypothetical protein